MAKHKDLSCPTWAPIDFQSIRSAEKYASWPCSMSHKSKTSQFPLTILIFHFYFVFPWTFPLVPLFLLYTYKCLFIFERVSKSQEGAEREGDRGSEVDSVLSAESPMRGSNSHTLRSWPELKSVARPTEPPRYPSRSTLLTNSARLFLCQHCSRCLNIVVTKADKKLLPQIFKLLKENIKDILSISVATPLWCWDRIDSFDQHANSTKIFFERLTSWLH